MDSSDVVTCTICHLQFKNSNAFRSHRSRKHTVKYFSCDFAGCNKSYVRLFAFEKHRAQHATKNPPLEATTAKRQNEGELILHCNYCTTTFTSIRSLRQHVYREHPRYAKNCDGGLFFQCDHCKHVLTTKHSLLRHIKYKHLGNVQTLTCSLCDFHTTSQRTLYEHVARKHSNYTYECDYCRKKFAVKQGLRKHIVNTHSGVPQVCAICSAKSKNRVALKRHYLRLHASQVVNCDFPGCGKYFVRPRDFEAHKVQHPAGYTPTDPTLTKQKIRPVVCHCDYCGRTFAKTSTLRLHISREHPKYAKEGSAVPSFQCDYCKQVVTTKVGLTWHINYKHLNNVKTFNCSLCDFKTKYKTTLRRHEARKHRSYKFQCDYCKKMFPVKHAVESHIINTHNNVPQSCTICGTQLKNVATLKYHYGRLHPDKLFKCDWVGCRRLFIQSGDFERHQAEHSTKDGAVSLPISTEKPQQSKVKPAKSPVKRKTVKKKKLKHNKSSHPSSSSFGAEYTEYNSVFFTVKQENEAVSPPGDFENVSEFAEGGAPPENTSIFVAVKQEREDVSEEKTSEFAEESILPERTENISNFVAVKQEKEDAPDEVEIEFSSQVEVKVEIKEET